MGRKAKASAQPKQRNSMGGLSRVKIAVGIVLVATTALYFTNALSSTPTNSEKAETETCNDEADSNPCGDLSDWLSRAGPVPGYHVFCVSDAGRALTLYLRGEDTKATTRNLKHPKGLAWTDTSEAELRPILESAVDVVAARRDANIRAGHARNRFAPQAWRLFSTQGVPVDTLDRVGIYLLYEGGQWLWPGVELGFKRTIQAHDREVTIVTISLKPLVVSVQDFLSEHDCEHIIGTAGKHMRQSQVSLMDKDKGRQATDFRTSETWFMPSQGSRMRKIDRRVANLTRTRVNQQEQVQVLRYLKHQRYSQHLDWFDFEEYKNDASMVEMIKGGWRNRMATVFWYMNDPPEGTDGGETNFGLAKEGFFLPEMAAYPGGRGPKGDCRFGMSVRPQKGKVIIFYSLLADGTGDPFSQHSACPPEGKDALKWAANKWVWNEPMGYTTDRLDERTHAPSIKSLQ